LRGGRNKGANLSRRAIDLRDVPPGEERGKGGKTNRLFYSHRKRRGGKKVTLFWKRKAKRIYKRGRHITGLQPRRRREGGGT